MRQFMLNDRDLTVRLINRQRYYLPRKCT